MKKILLPLLFILMLSACTKEEKYCWTITVKTVTSSNPIVGSYPITKKTTEDKCDLTESDIKSVLKGYESTSTVKALGITYITTVTAWATKK
jgi:hypothetical protein